MRRFLIFAAVIVGFFIILFSLIKNFQERVYKDYKIIPEEVSVGFKEIRLEKNPKESLPKFNLTSKSKLLKNFGVTSKEALKRHPEIFLILKKMDPSIEQTSLDAGSENIVVTLPGERKYIVLNGCSEKKEDFKCDGTVRIIVIDPIDERIYMLAENGAGRYASEPKVNIYGNPSSDVTKLLLYSYYF